MTLTYLSYQNCLSRDLKRNTMSKSPDCPPYPLRPKGLFSVLPLSWVPLAELARVHKPIGIIVIWLPYPLGLALAAVTSSVPIPISTMLYMNILLLLASAVLRSAGCTWNDVVDCELDQKVARCCHRPVARGAITPFHGTVFFAAQTLVWLGIMWLAEPRSLVIAVPNLALVLLYPYAKRVSDYPQIVLGMTLAWGVLSGSTVLRGPERMLWEESGEYILGLGLLVAAYVAWTVVYDTVYAFQDLHDDELAGIKSTAVRWRHSAKLLLTSTAAFQVGCLFGLGLQIDAGSMYYLLACAGSAVDLGTMIYRVDLEDVGDCSRWFQDGIMAVGLCMTGGLIAEYSVNPPRFSF